MNTHASKLNLRIRRGARGSSNENLMWTILLVTCSLIAGRVYKKMTADTAETTAKAANGVAKSLLNPSRD